MAAEILVVEDDERIRKALRLALEEEQYQVVEARSTEEALEAFGRRPAELVLVDVMLPGLDGFDLCRSLRRHSDVPIIIVTARSDSHDVVAGLEAGADDYVTKPFIPKELSARIRALLRRVRSGEAPGVALRFGTLEIDPDAGIVRRQGEVLSLTKTELMLLCELAAGAPRLMTREMLLGRVWGYDYFGDGRLVDVHVRRLRRKIEDDPAHPNHLVTVRGLGYRLQA